MSQVTSRESAVGTQRRPDIRNVAIIAHVDHGKTTLVDGLLKQSNIFSSHEQVGELILDRNDLERERGITILAKNTAVTFRGVKINIIDTPGHADFSGEVERVLGMADGCLLLVDAVEGPMSQTRYVLKKALALGLRPILVINKIDRTSARPAEVLASTQDLFLELATDADQLDFPVIYTIAREGRATLDPSQPGDNLVPLFETIVNHVPGPIVEPEGGAQLLVSALDYDSYKGKILIGRIARGRLCAGAPVVRIDYDGAITPYRIAQLFVHYGLERVEVDCAEAGEIVALTGVTECKIGETIADAEQPDALPPIAIEPPTVKMTFGVNTSPFAGREGRFVTSRQIRERLFRELETNVALRVSTTETPDEFLVAGRGELHLAILVETLRREGYEFQVSRPEVITREIDGVLQEPVELLTVDTIEEYIGPISEELSARLAELANVVHDQQGGVRLEYRIPTRGLIGARNALLTKTRGNCVISSILLGYEPVRGETSSTRNGALVATETGVATTYGLLHAQERGETFIEPVTPIYEGMIVGTQRRGDDLGINVAKTKKMTNVRSSTSEIDVRLSPPVRLSLDQSLDFLADDELLEVTPKSLRLRKRLLTADERAKVRAAARDRRGD